MQAERPLFQQLIQQLFINCFYLPSALEQNLPWRHTDIAFSTFSLIQTHIEQVVVMQTSGNLIKVFYCSTDGNVMTMLSYLSYD